MTFDEWDKHEKAALKLVEDDITAMTPEEAQTRLTWVLAVVFGRTGLDVDSRRRLRIHTHGLLRQGLVYLITAAGWTLDEVIAHDGEWITTMFRRSEP